MMTSAQALARAQARALPLIQLALCPMAPTRHGPASMMAPRPLATSLLNQLAGRLSKRVLWSARSRSSSTRQRAQPS